MGKLSTHVLDIMHGKPAAAGDVIHQPELGKTLRAIAKNGRDAFYTGEIAADMVETLRGIGGLHTLEDFAAHGTETTSPIGTMYKGHDVWQCPPNGPGITMLVMLNILSRFDLTKFPALSVERFHLEAEAARIAYMMREQYIGDPAQVHVDVFGILAKEFAEEHISKISMDRLLDLPNVAPPMNPSTVYITVVDKDRNVCSFINSIAHSFGSAIVSDKTGVLLQNRAGGFRIQPGHPNCIAPGKRPLHTIIPSLATKGGRAVMPFVAPLVRHTLRRAQSIVVSDASMICNSPFLEPRAGKCLVVPFGTDVGYWQRLDDDQEVEVERLRRTHPRLVVATGRLVPYKGFATLIEALAHVDDRVDVLARRPRGRWHRRTGRRGRGLAIGFPRGAQPPPGPVHAHRRDEYHDRREDEPQPTEAEINLLRAWIDAGAKGPDGEQSGYPELSTPKIAPAAGVHQYLTSLALSPAALALRRESRADAVYWGDRPERSPCRPCNPARRLCRWRRQPARSRESLRPQRRPPSACNP